MSRWLQRATHSVRALPVVCGAVLCAGVALHSRDATAAAAASATELLVLDVEGAERERMSAIVRELLGRIQVAVQSADDSSRPVLLYVKLHLDGTRGGFVARREPNGPVIARSEASYETEELLREALAHTLLSLVDAVKQGQPVPEDLQELPDPSAEASTRSNPDPVPTRVRHAAVTQKQKPAATKNTTKPWPRPIELWQLSVAGTCGFMDASHPMLGLTLGMERRLDAAWGVGAALSVATAPEFHAQGFVLDLNRQGFSGFATWRVFERSKTRLALAPFFAIQREVAEAVQGRADLAEAQSKWLPALGAHARWAHRVRSLSFEAELGLRALPTAPRLFVSQGSAELTLFEPWSVQPELGLRVGMVF